MDEGTRRAIFDRARDRAEAAGTPIESDPRFIGWVELWIIGEIDLNELKRRYSDLLVSRNVRSRISRLV